MSARPVVTVVLATGDTRGWTRRLGVSPVAEVYYFGSGYERLSELRVGAGPGVRVNSAGPLVDALADKTLETMRNLDQCMCGAVARRWWEASSLGERNQLNSGCHFRLCMLIAFVERLGSAGALVVMVDDWWFARRLTIAARAAGRVIKAVDLSGRSLHIGLLAAGLQRACALWRGLRVQRQWLSGVGRQAREVRVQRGTISARSSLRGCDVLITLWGNTHTFTAGNGDVPYLGSVPAIFAKSGLRVGFLLMPVDWAQPFADIARAALISGRPVLLLPEWVRWGDRIRVMFAVLAFALTARPRLRVDGTDVSGLLGDEVLREAQDTRMAFALLMRCAGKWLATHDSRPRLVIHPYENQNWEKTLRRGVREALPGTRVVGCMHMPGSTRFVSFYPSDRDLYDGATPDRLSVLGPAVRDEFTAHGFRADRLEIGGAVRMPDWPLALRETFPERHGGIRFGRVLVATGMSGGDSLELLCKSLPGIVALREMRAVVTFHPQVGADARAGLRRAALDAVNDVDAVRIEFAEGRTSELLAEVDVVIYNVSAAAFDAVIAGVPVIFVQSEVAVDLDKLPAGASLSARSTPEIRAAIETLMGESGPRLARTARQIVSPMFAPAAVEPWAHLASELCSSCGEQPPDRHEVFAR